MIESKKVLGAVFSLTLEGTRPTASTVAARACIEEESSKRVISVLAGHGWLRNGRAGISLTEEGRKKLKVVFIGGGFEVIHRGHLYTIERAKALGDILVVSVARDTTIRRRKKREPLANENERLRLLSSLRQVDVAMLGVEGNIYDTLQKVGPDVVALGYDQYHTEADVVREAARRGMKISVVRLDSPYPKIKTSSLLSDT